MLALLSNIDPIFIIGLIIVGILIGILAAMIGIGGGLVMVPFLVLIIELTAQQASSVSLFVIIFTSGSGSFAYYRQKRIDVRTGLYFALFVVPCAFIGSWFSSKVNSEILVLLFGFLLLIVATQRTYKLIKKLTSKNDTQNGSSAINEPVIPPTNTKNSFLPQSIEYRNLVDSEGNQFSYQIRLRRTLIGAAIGGFISGLLGVGGGIIFVPVLLASGVPAHITVATSSFIIVFSSLSGSTARLLHASVLFNIAIPLLIGTVTGARIGATRVKKISSEHVLIMFYVIVFLAGIRMILKAIGWFP